jgi:acyl dehydratase
LPRNGSETTPSDGQARKPHVVDVRATGFGRYLDDFEVGEVIRHWPGRTVTEAEDHLFCMLTGAVSPIHIDAHYAKTEMEGGRNLVVGTFIYSLLLGMTVPQISGLAVASLGVERLRHTAPLYHGDTLYAETRVDHIRSSKSRPGTGVLTVTTTGLNQDRVTVCEFTRTVLLPRRPQERSRSAGGSARDPGRI